jgi:proton-translocating NADH-quinone oxidoreductase chain L
MLVLICGGNFLVMFVGWESIGVVSYLLINYYFTRVQANKAAILAFTMNRGGDMLMSIGFFAIFSIFGSLSYSEIFSLVPFINETTITIISLFLLGGALAKSANIPLHSWLPGSMEAPTPVSALLHAATLVTAGIYLLIRVSPILEYSSTALLVITIIGSTTAFIAATCGLLANDLKRIIAFSTISQLGYMMMAIGLSQYNVALMHTVNHAFFKALLFLGAGAVIHSFADQQDVRKMGGLIKFLPFTYSVMLTGSLSLLATPYLTGFYSKDLILELAFGQYNFSGIYAYILGSITAGITAFYSFRLISLVFLTTPNGNKQSYINSYATLTHPPLGEKHLPSPALQGEAVTAVRVAVTAVRVASQPLPLAQARNWECSALTAGAVQSYGAVLCGVASPSQGIASKVGTPQCSSDTNSSFGSNTNTYPYTKGVAALLTQGDKLNLIVNFPLLFLALFSIFFGFVFSDLFVGMGSDFFKNSIFIHPKNISLIEAEFSLQSSLSSPLSQLPFPNSYEGCTIPTPTELMLGPSATLTAVTALQGYNILFKLLPAILSITGALSAIILYHLPFLFLINCPTAASQAVKEGAPHSPHSCPAGEGEATYGGVGITPTLSSHSSHTAVGGGLTAVSPNANPTPTEASSYNKIGRNIYAFLNGKYYFDVIYNHFIFQSGLKLGYNISKEIDRGAIELLGPYGLSNYFYNAGKNLAKLDTGVITTYSLYITIALISLLFILFSPAIALATNYLHSPLSTTPLSQL